MAETAVPNKLGHAERRARFREYMRRFNPTAPAGEAIASQLVIPDIHESLYSKLGSRAELEPGSRQLLVGGVGSGKTTELILAAQWLSAQPEMRAIYIDVSAETDLSSIISGALLASLALHLANDPRVTPAESDGEDYRERHKSTLVEVQKFAEGETKLVSKFDFFPLYIETTTIPGRLKRPFPALQSRFKEIEAPLQFLLTRVRGSGDLAVIFDGLDRIFTPEKFWSAVESDLGALEFLRVSTILAGPISLLYGTGQSILDRFSRVHRLAPISTQSESLMLVLKQRGYQDILDDLVASSIAASSGGVLRDLIVLAKDSASEAYVAGRDRITPADAAVAARQLGLGYLRGLGPAQIEALMKLSKTGAVDLASDDGINLLVTRRILEYSPTDFRVHPALFPLLGKPEARIA